MEKLEFGKSNSQPFELVLANRNAEGEPTGSYKSMVFDNAYKMSQFYLRHTGKPKKKVKSGESPKLVKTTDGLQAYIDTSERETIDDGQSR